MRLVLVGTKTTKSIFLATESAWDTARTDSVAWLKGNTHILFLQLQACSSNIVSCC